MHRSLEIDLHLAPGLRNENFVAVALDNLAAYQFQEVRHEPL